MRNYLVLAAIGALAPSPAFAAQFTAVVSEIDAAAHTVVLTNGQSMTIVDSVDARDIMAGDHVTVTTNDATGKVTDIYPVE